MLTSALEPEQTLLKTNHSKTQQTLTVQNLLERANRILRCGRFFLVYNLVCGPRGFCSEFIDL